MNDASFDSNRPDADAGRGDSGRDPVDPQGVTGPPPPPPPGAYPPPWGQPKKKPGVFGSIGKIFSALSVCAVLFFAGYYVALFTVLGAGGRVDASLYQSGEGDEKIAIIPVTGMIVPETADFIHNAVETAIEDQSVKAIVLHVDSGGGMVGPSEQIYHELSRLKAARGIPIIASFGGYAASGGYYVACAADYIYAQPACVTGSIGVIAQAMTFEQMLRDNGIQPLVLTAETSPQKAVANKFLESWDENDKNTLRRMLTVMHERFRDVVRQARGQKMGEELFEQATGGEVYLTQAALQMKLIDSVGYLDDAILKARDEANIAAQKPPVLKYAPRMGLFDAIVGVSRDRSPITGLELDGQKLRRLMMELGTPRAMYWYQP